MKKSMKITALILSAAFIFTAVWQIVSLVAESPIRQFSVKQLTPQQIAACSAFKISSNQPRHSQLERVQKLGILPSAPVIRENWVLHTAKVGLHVALPLWFGDATSNVSLDDGHPQFIMTREDVTDLLGEPSSLDKNYLRYYIGILDGSHHFFIIRFHSGHVAGTGGLEIQ